jgi:hypothetical protein
MVGTVHILVHSPSKHFFLNGSEKVDDAVNNLHHTLSNDLMAVTMNWKEYGRKQPWINLWYCPNICLNTEENHE